MELKWLQNEIGFLLPSNEDIKFILFEGENLPAGWKQISKEDLLLPLNVESQRVIYSNGDLKVQVDLESHDNNVFLWEVKLLGNVRTEFQDYTAVRVGYKKPLFDKYFAPCFYEPDARAWEGKVPLDLTRSVNGFSVSNNYLVLSNNGYSLLLGTVGLIPDGTQTISTMGASLKIKHNNTYAESFPKGILIIDEQRMGAINKFNQINSSFLTSRNKRFSWWQEPQWCTWVDYREDITEDIVLAEAQSIRKSGFPIRSIVIDAGWYDWSGNWEAHPKRFPSGMKKLVEQLHALDFKVILWINPHAVKKESPNFSATGEGLVLNEQGKPYGRFTDWPREGRYFWDPTHPTGKRVIRNWLDKAINEWKVDGFKVDYIYVGPEGKFQTLIPLEPNTYVYEITKLFYETAKSMREDVMISGSYYNQVLAMFQDDLRAGDTFGGCNQKSLAVAQHKMNMAKLQVPDILYVNDYIGSYDKPLEVDIFLKWIEWLVAEPSAILAFGWQPWLTPLLNNQAEIIRVMNSKANLIEKAI